MLIKLTTKDGYSIHGGVLWEVGKTVEIPECNRSLNLCSAGLLHVYEADSVHLPLMLNPRHACIGPGIRAFVVSGIIVARDGQLKAGGHRFSVLRELLVPEITTEHRVLFAIMCAFEAAIDTVTWATTAHAADAAAVEVWCPLEPGLLSHLAQEACKP